MKTKEMAYISLFAALMIVLAFIPPITLGFTPVPITIQTLGVMLTGILLGSRLGLMSQLLFLLLIAIGVPGLAGGNGGIGAFLLPSAGYLISWPLAACVIGYLLERSKETTYLKTAIACFVGGILLVYAIGIPVQAFLTKVPLVPTAISSFTFLPGDITKVIIATILGTRLRRRNVLNIQQKNAA